MFAIIDIETCGGKFEFRKGRITEICILIHDGLSVVETYTTLLNPECFISPMFTNITGITNKMVEDAPRFCEVAKKILELTEGKIFVAHNVGFDYNFLKDEFNSLGFKFRRETLCTVRLSRKLLPGHASYSLGNLCDSLGIQNLARHRAHGDALATAILFDRLMQAKNMHAQYKNKGVVELMARRIDNIKKYILDKLPESCGVYFFLAKDGSIIYIGKSVNMYSRALSHFNSDESKGKKMLNDLYNVDFVETGSELIALLLESEQIKLHKPKYNRLRKADVFTHAIEWFKDNKGIINFRIVESELAENALISFTSYIAARERLENWIEENSLCLQYCALTNEGSICFNHQIKKCNGICAGKEDKAKYNLRTKKILSNFIFESPNFLIFDHGRQGEEQSVILVEKGKFAGYGYMDPSMQFTSVQEFKEMVKKATYYPDSDDLIRSWLKKKNRKTVLF
ncbi:MAG: GIY-YIG nuclease family protein [Bacteroidetes bacterium]|nr:GIY-YIG nuclease family protein [Bacteroidota bacterium]HET6244530.1 exonuclease domain-containing protein [Bacteroidia bacterium]